MPQIYDTKVQSTAVDHLKKSDLHYLYSVCTGKKNFSNNLSFGPDEEADVNFGAYEKNQGQDHDAGFDSFMTGVVFSSLAKYIEIGKMLDKIDES